MKIQYNGSSKILKRLVELVNRSQNVALRQDSTDKNTLYWTGLDGVEITVNIPSGAVEVDAELSETSTNPVENQAITKELAQKADKSAIPTVGDGVLSVQRNGRSVGTFSANAAKDTAVNIPVPEKVSELENDAGYGTYTKPTAGIPKSDLASGVQASLSKADTALQKHQDISGKLDKTGDASSTTASFAAASSRENVKTGEKLSVLFGKIAKWFTDLKAVAFSGSYKDLSDKPTIPDISGKQDKLTAGANVMISGNVISAKDTTYSNVSTTATGLMTAADKKKLDGMDLSQYLPLSGGVMTGNIDLASKGVDLLVGTQRAAQGTYASAVAGAALAGKEPLETGLSKRKSLIGSWLDQNSVWHSILSVRHRNGWNDGPNYGFYLKSSLTSSGDLWWNKQTGESKWQGERTLLDSINYSNYAAPLSHTHKNIDSIGNVGYYGSDKASTNGWYKFHSGTLTGYNDRTARLMLTYMYGYNNFGTIFFHARCNNGNTIQIQRLLWEVRSGFEDGDVVAVAKGNDYSLYVYNRNPQWGRIKIRVLESGGTSSAWDMTLASNFTKESTAPTPTIVASDGCTVANAKTLTDSGWVAMTVEGYYAKSGTVKYRTYGKQITITGSVVLKNDIATSYPAPQDIASTTFDFSSIVGCSGVGRSSSGVGAYVTTENYGGENLVCVNALGSKIAAGSTLNFTITGFID